MHDKKDLLHAKSYTGIYDIFGSMPFTNVLYRNQHKQNNDNTIKQEVNVDSDKKCKTLLITDPPYITSEIYNSLNKDTSCRSVYRSTSTIFYDLDDLAKRHSFHCLAEVSMSNANILKVMKLPVTSGFEGKSDAIVQECATQIQPKLLVKDSIEMNVKKIKNKKFPQNDTLSSEIFLRDNGYVTHCRKNQYFNIDVTNRQKFWSYAKYRTEYTKPVTENKIKKKDKGKRIEDPCPCQLFSYACPCVNEKSLTELAKNNNCLTSNQITSTTKVAQDAKKKKPKNDTSREDKPTNTIVVEKIDVIVEPKNDHIVQNLKKPDTPPLNYQEKCINNKSSSLKKSHKVICPNCKEKVDVISITEEEESLTSECRYGSKEIPSTAAYNCSTGSTKANKNKNDNDNKDVCSHEPRCELIPVCQILPTDDIYINPKCAVKKRSSTKPYHPRIIRITKACRHHPPCTVVPSCQRANVLRNNCEYIPPCLHRPRCVNLPLCVPLAKSIHYEEPGGLIVDDDENSLCPHNPKCKMMPLCQHDSLTNNVEHHYNTHIHEYYDDFTVNPNPSPISNPASPCLLSKTDSPSSSRSNKSCQFGCCHYKCDSTNVREGTNPDTIIYIRDVGCQFKSKAYSPKDSCVHSKTSSASFNGMGVKTGNYYSILDAPVVRCRDKSTKISVGDSLSTDSMISVEVDSNCPSHGHRYSKARYSGFQPRSAYVAAYAKMESVPAIEKHRPVNKTDSTMRHRDTFPVKSRRSFLKGRYRKMFTVKRRRHSKTSNLSIHHNPKNV